MSPWAKFTTRMTPKISERPTAMRLMTPPKSSPLRAPWAISTGSITLGGSGAAPPPSPPTTSCERLVAGRSGLRPREDGLLERGLPGPHRHGLLPHHLDHGGHGARVVADL